MNSPGVVHPPVTGGGPAAGVAGVAAAAVASPAAPVGGRGIVLLFGTGLLCGAILMFLLEPMAAKMVLPFLGGAPAVWNTCVVFFQAMLLAGYAYAHAGSRWLGVRRHAGLHSALLLVSILALPLSLQMSSPPGDANPTGWLLLALFKSIALPFFLLATTAPLLQQWFSRTRHHAARDPYFLYAASNFGSFIGLLLYPLVVEPLLPLRLQASYWRYGYAAFALVMIACATLLRRQPDPAVSRDPEVAARDSAMAPAPDGLRRLRWIGLSFAPSSLMIAVTTFISTDIAAVPLLWVVPLALYLLTFVLAFATTPRYPRRLVDRGLALLILPLVMCLMLQISGPIVAVVPIHLAVFVLASLVCHRALADDRPDAAHLTEFYLLVAFGGVLGSLFNTLVAPLVFTGILEYPIVLVLVCLLRNVPREGVDLSRTSRYVLPALVAVAAVALMLIAPRIESVPVRFAVLGVPAILCLRLSRTRLPFAAAIAAMLIAGAFQPDELGRVLYAERTFFGAYKVRTEPGGAYRTLAHGTTLHGVQSVEPSRRAEPLSYYHRTGPLGDVLGSVPAAATHPRIGVVGLGVGSVASYRQPGQVWTFFEIDPAVETIARRQEFFSYLSDCGEACRVVIGDARQSLAAEPGVFGAIVLDAFSSDAIPLHLVTREALRIYLARLAPGGVLAFHISNRHLNLEPVLTRLAEGEGLVSFVRRDYVPPEDKTGKRSSEWLVMARRAEDLGPLAASEKWTAARAGSAAVWTDDFSNILSLLVR